MFFLTAREGKRSFGVLIFHAGGFICFFSLFSHFFFLSLLAFYHPYDVLAILSSRYTDKHIEAKAYSYSCSISISIFIILLCFFKKYPSKNPNFRLTFVKAVTHPPPPPPSPLSLIPPQAPNHPRHQRPHFLSSLYHLRPLCLWLS